MTHASLFSGIGGPDLAAEWMGWENVFHCEINPFGQKVLKYYWPNAISYEDIKTTDFSVHRGTIDVLTGGFPCQPYSTAGLRKGKEDERHLWPEMLRAIREIKPRWIVGENVLGIVSWNGGMVFQEVQADLEAEGYQVQPYVLPACAVDAPHRRDRVWFVAYCESFGRGTGLRKEADSYRREATEHKSKGSKVRDKYSAISGTRISTDTERDGHHVNKCNSEGQQSNGRWQTRCESSSSCKSRYAADSNGDGKRLLCGHEACNRRKDAKHPVNSDDGSCRDVTNANSEQRCQGGMHSDGSKETERYTCSYDARSFWRPSWDQFPTQSPIRFGNDGLSERLDRAAILKATRSKSDRGSHYHRWRTESIKAGGNAIVPQVIYQIFKAIQAYENDL